MMKIIPVLIFCLTLSACAALPAFAPTTETVSESPTKSSSPDCAPASNWTIEYHRTGGFAGFDQSLTLKSDGSLAVQSKKPPLEKQATLPADHLKAVNDLLVQACPFELAQSQGVCADCYMHSLEIQMDSRFYSVQATDTTLTEELQPLIGALDEFLKVTSQ
jgi:hypothetical protein